jgi:hypothetical protein
MKISELPDFKHKAPKNYHYEVEEFKRNVLSIWLCYDGFLSHKGEKDSKTIWGFFNTKKAKYFSPVNSKMMGKEVRIQNTRSWTSMQLLQTPLEAAFK